MKRENIEIMAPVGSYEALHAAISAGANSVYFGIGTLNMRAASAANFTPDDMTNIIRIAHQNGVRAYLTVNTIIYDDELGKMHEIVDAAQKAGIDAIIASDLSVIDYAYHIGVEIHISTQCNISNTEAVKFYSQWADVVVLARELSLEQIKHIHDEIVEQDIRGPHQELVRIEMFAHGALCMSISGKCYLSEHETHCSANRGACRQICRRKYTIQDKDTGQMLDIDGRYILSPKDLCTVDFLDKFIECGVSVLKIEGRARGGEYVKRVVGCYDCALRAIEEGKYDERLAENLKKDLLTVFNRGFWGGYYAGKPIAEHTSHYGSSATLKKEYVGKITNFFSRLSVAELTVEASTLRPTDRILIMGETTGVVELTAPQLMIDGKPMDEVRQGDVCSLKTPCVVRRGDKLYKEVCR
ncbi:MAG: U32 family peptidase [Alistipes sp.]|nr:U32 family peptidase [Candidatus Alistipes equi]